MTAMPATAIGATFDGFVLLRAPRNRRERRDAIAGTILADRPSEAAVISLAMKRAEIELEREFAQFAHDMADWAQTSVGLADDFDW